MNDLIERLRERYTSENGGLHPIIEETIASLSSPIPNDVQRMIFHLGDTENHITAEERNHYVELIERMSREKHELQDTAKIAFGRIKELKEDNANLVSINAAHRLKEDELEYSRLAYSKKAVSRLHQNEELKKKNIDLLRDLSIAIEKVEELESKLRTYAMFDVQTASELAEDLAAKEKRIEELTADRDAMDEQRVFNYERAQSLQAKVEALDYADISEERLARAYEDKE